MACTPLEMHEWLEAGMLDDLVMVGHVQRDISMPPTSVPPQDRSESVAQLQWVRDGDALLIVNVIENVDPPLAVQLTLLQFLV